jgi:cation diffusion facilitator family transporter
MAARSKDIAKHRVAMLAAWSIPVALAVLALKFAAWWITGSVALYSDALESIVNVIAAFFALWAIRISHLPADDNHPFGHHKAEYLSAVVEGALIIVAALLICREAFFALQRPMPLEQPWPGLALNAVGGALNAIWAWVLIRVGRQERSPALEADGRHILTDVWTSVGVIVGLVAAVATGWAVLDPLLAIAVAINILYQGWHVIGSSVQGLMDVGVDAEQ